VSGTALAAGLFRRHRRLAPCRSVGHPTQMAKNQKPIGSDQRRFTAPAHHDCSMFSDSGPALAVSWSHPTMKKGMALTSERGVPLARCCARRGAPDPAAGLDSRSPRNRWRPLVPCGSGLGDPRTAPDSEHDARASGCVGPNPFAATTRSRIVLTLAGRLTRDRPRRKCSPGRKGQNDVNPSRFA